MSVALASLTEDFDLLVYTDLCNYVTKLAEVLLIALSTYTSFHLHYNRIEQGREAISRKTSKLSEIAASRPMSIALQCK